MTTVQITLPDRLAEEAERAGLLDSERIAGWIEEQLRSRQASQVLAAIAHMAALEEPESLSPEAIAEEVEKLRRQRHIHGEHKSS